MSKLSQPHKNTTNRLLGYPDDGRLLILNADDFGMCHAINDAILRSLKDGIVCSTSLMTPCPWAAHAMNLLRENPDIPFGVHLTVISEMPLYRWGPLTSKERVPSLVDETGRFWSAERIPEFQARAQLDELELEFRAQIETVLAAGLEPTHLDWHCLPNGGRDDIFDLTVRLAKEYRLAVRAYDSPYIEALRSESLPSDDHPVPDSYRLDPIGKSEHYARMLREVPPGLSEWAVHPGLGDAELQAVEPTSWQVRQTDYEFAISPEAREIIEQEGIILLSYQPLQAVWQGRAS